MPSRALFAELFAAARVRCARTQSSGALLLLDLDGFKGINDGHGHLCGDHTLRAFAERIRSTLRSSDLVARLGGDEFVVLLAEPTTLEEARGLGETLRCAFTKPLQVPGLGHLIVNASIGVAALDGDTTVTDALSAADEAMYTAKRERYRRTAQRQTAPKGSDRLG